MASLPFDQVFRSNLGVILLLHNIKLFSLQYAIPKRGCQPIRLTIFLDEICRDFLLQTPLLLIFFTSTNKLPLPSIWEETVCFDYSSCLLVNLSGLSMLSPIQDIKSLLDDVEDEQLFEVLSKAEPATLKTLLMKIQGCNAYIATERKKFRPAPFLSIDYTLTTY